MRTIGIVVLLAVLAGVGFGQVPLVYRTEAGIGGYLKSSPHSAASLNLLISGDTNRAASFTTIEIRPVSAAAPSTTVTSGLQYIAGSNGKLELAAITQGGGSSTLTGSSFDVNGGLKINYYPGWSRAKGLYFALSGQAAYNSQFGLDPKGMAWVGYQFNGVAQSLSIRRALAKLRR